jgi:hypothetical protein
MGSRLVKVSRVRHMVPGRSRESLPKRKVRFADHPGVTLDSVKIESYRFSLPIRSVRLGSTCFDPYVAEPKRESLRIRFRATDGGAAFVYK